jgi:hypothetical protein
MVETQRSLDVGDLARDGGEIFALEVLDVLAQRVEPREAEVVKAPLGRLVGITDGAS